MFHAITRTLLAVLSISSASLLLTPATTFSKQISPKTQANDSSPSQVMINLKELGKENGISFEGAETGHEAKLTFTAPRDTTLSSASIHLRYETSPLLNEHSNILILVNGYPLKQVQLTDAQYRHELKADIPVHLIRPGKLDVTIKAALLISDDRCLDSRINGALLHIEPDSTLTMRYRGAIASLRDAWTLLPEKVTLTVPDRAFTENEYNATWEIMDRLYRQGKEITLSHFPEIGHIVIGNRDTLYQHMLKERADQQPGSTSKSATIALVSNPLRSVISISRPENISASALMSDTWQKLIAGHQYKTFNAKFNEKLNSSAQAAKASSALEIRLSDLGLDTSTRYVRTNTEWKLLLDPFRMPAGTRPARVFADLIAPPPPGKPAFALYAYLNGILVHAQQLDASSDVQHIEIPLPARYQQLYNDLRIQIMHSQASGDCRHDLPAFPVQLLPGSALIIERTTRTPERFVDLPSHLADRFEFYLPAAYLKQPDLSLPFIAAFTARYPVPFVNRKAVFVAKGDKVAPMQPFIALGDVSFEDLNAPVRFDRGSVEVLDSSGASLLNVDALSGIAVAQLVTSNGKHGLWLRAGDSDPYPDVRRLFLNEDNVAFADRSGLLFSLNSAEPTLARVHYPASRDWMATLGAYRFWIMAVFWLALIVGIAYLFRRTRQHQSSR